MKLSGPQFLDISVLNGALVRNTNGAEFFIIGISFSPAEHEIYIDLQDAEDPDNTLGVAWSAIADWELQLRAHRHPAGC